MGRDRPPRRSSRENKAGSEDVQVNSSEPDFLIVGRIVRPHGVRGELAMKILTQFPEHLANLETLYVGPNHTPRSLARLRRTPAGMIILLEGIANRDQAEKLRGALVHIHIDDAIPLGDGEVYLYQIQGIRVVSDTGQELGKLTGLIETGANDVYVVTNEQGNELLLPAIPDVIRQIDVTNQLMTVHLLEGLV
jgi:16S rRNA processing protein RimM